MAEPTALHLWDDERSEEDRCANSTVRLKSCSGALLLTDEGGRRRLVAAHRGARKCAEALCRKRYRQRVFALALAGIEEARERGVRYVKLLTLTLPSLVMVPAEWVDFGPHWRAELSGRKVEIAPNSICAYRYFAECFNRFQTAARRKWRYDYFRVVEEGTKEPYRSKKTGELMIGSERVHYHLIVMSDKFMRQGELATLAQKAGLGPVTDIRAASTARQRSRVAGYLSSYAAKHGGLVTPAQMRFFVTSRAWARAHREHLKELRAAERAVRRAAGRDAVFVKNDDIERLLASDPTIEDCRGATASGPQRLEGASPLSRTTNGPQAKLEAAA